MSNELPTSWKKAQTMSAIIASVLIPLMIAFLGHIVNQSIKDNELSLSYIQLAVGILKVEPKPGTENLRAWAIDVVNNYSSVKLPTDAKKELKEHSLPLIEATDRNPLSERADYLRKHKATESGISKPGDSFHVKQHLLLNSSRDPVSVVESQNTSGKLLEHKLMVLHFTGGVSSESTLRWIAKAKSNASMHILIDRNGVVTQLVPFDYVAWHAGRSSWKDLTNLNEYSIGISFENAGQLNKKGEKWVSLFGKAIPISEVYIDTDPASGEERGWHKYTEAQIATAMKVAPAIATAYPTIEALVGHSEVTKGRKSDPGPAFPISELKFVFDKIRRK